MPTDDFTPTPRQQQVLAAIDFLSASWGCAPTVRELGEHLGITSTNGTADHLKALARKGLAEWTPRRARTVRLTSSGRRWLRRRAA